LLTTLVLSLHPPLCSPLPPSSRAPCTLDRIFLKRSVQSTFNRGPPGTIQSSSPQNQHLHMLLPKLSSSSKPSTSPSNHTHPTPHKIICNRMDSHSKFSSPAKTHLPKPTKLIIKVTATGLRAVMVILFIAFRGASDVIWPAGRGKGPCRNCGAAALGISRPQVSPSHTAYGKVWKSNSK